MSEAIMTPPDPHTGTTAEPDYGVEMRLPAGKTCADCAHIRRCVLFGFSEGDRTSCDFWPNRFRLALPQGDGGEG